MSDKKLIYAGDARRAILEADPKLAYCIERIKAVDAVEAVHGRWRKAYLAGYLKCNRCEDAFIYEEWLKSGKWNYCPNCGADMRGEAE